MKPYLLFFSLFVFLFSCVDQDILDDFREPEIRIMNSIDSISVDSSFQFNFLYFNNVGQEEDIMPSWTSSDNTIAEIDDTGKVTGISEGDVTIKASFLADDISVEAFRSFRVVEEEMETVITEEVMSIMGQVETTTFYDLEGDFTLQADGDDLVLEFGENFKVSSGLPGLYIYLTNNESSIAEAYEIAKITKFNGEQTHMIEGVGINDFAHILFYCKPFNVPVGIANLQ